MIQSVKVKNLSLSKDNVRKRNRDTDFEGFVENIAEQGLLQNLIVTPLKKAGHFTVKAGGRRLRALQRLIEQGRLPVDHEVPVLVLTDDNASVEASLAENFQRVPMNPADECTAFNFFIQKGMSAEDIAKRQGVTTRFVEQRVRLAELASCVFEALAAGEISLGVAQAYAVTSDTDRQAQVFNQMQASYYGDTPDNIKRAILNGSTKATDAMALFVGRDDYVAAGGAISRDLFSSEADETWSDSAIIEQLAQAKLEAAAVQLAGAEGYAFVTPVLSTRMPYDLERQYHEYHPTPRDLTDDERGRVDALSTEHDTLIEQLEDGTPAAGADNDRLDAIEEELEQIDAARKIIDPALKPQLGTFVFIGQDGEVRFHTRLFSEKPVIDSNAPRPPVNDGAIGESGGDVTEVDHGPKMSAALTDELATQRRQILVAHLASDPSLALDLSIFLMAQKIVYPHARLEDHSTLKAEQASFPLVGFRDEESLASVQIEEQRQSLDQSWAGHETMSARFDAFRQLSDEARAAWIGFAIARTLEPTINVAEGYRANGFHDHLGRLLDIEVEHWWRPTAANYFGRIKKDVMLEALEDIGGPVLRARYKDAKKGELASTCAALCDGKGIVEAEVRDKALAWLPDAMRFEGVDKPNRHVRLQNQQDDDDDEDGTGEVEVGDETDIAAPSDDVAVDDDAQEYHQAA
ncbi:MAG: ParB/RepB/Spo0J family partition protein [Novosphingobium sp.]